MGRHSNYPTLIDDLRTLRAGPFKPYLKEPGYYSVTTKWSDGASISGFLSVQNDTASLNISYIVDRAKKYNYTLGLTAIPSNLGIGQIWYFICPITDKKAKKLYMINEVFMHREALLEGFYSSQIQSKKLRVRRKPYKYFDLINELESKGFTPYYNGLPTRRYKKIKNELSQINLKELVVGVLK